MSDDVSPDGDQAGSCIESTPYPWRGSCAHGSRTAGEPCPTQAARHSR